MIDTRRKLLTEALGEKWHDYKLSQGRGISTCDCGNKGMSVWNICTKVNRTFASADDYEALREKVIVPNLRAFNNFFEGEYWKRRIAGGVHFLYTKLEWWFTLSNEECCEIICDFGIACLGWEEKK